MTDRLYLTGLNTADPAAPQICHVTRISLSVLTAVWQGQARRRAYASEEASDPRSLLSWRNATPRPRDTITS